MQINQIENPSGSILVYPYWDDDEEINHVLPQKLIKKIENDNKLTPFAKNNYKRYFIDQNDIIVIHIGKKNFINLDSIRQFSSLALKRVKKYLFGEVNIFLFSKKWNLKNNDCIYAFLESLYLSDYRFKGYKKEEKLFDIKKVNIINEDKVSDFDKINEKCRIICDSVKMTRDLINEPANICNIDYIEKKSLQISKENNLNINVIDKKKLEKMGMNLLLAVGRGSIEEPRLIEIKYNQDNKKPTICLIGKGITYDTGGINLKPGSALDDMKSDMSGAATVLGIINACSKLKLSLNLIGLLPLAENSIDGKSFRPGDILVGFNKKSIEIKNTDAEGRLILADALSYSDTKKCNTVIDFATLTGAAIVALGTKITAGFFKNKTIKKKILEAGRKTGEPIWELPLFDDYKEMIKNDISDLRNIGEPPREAGTIIGALFLDEFIENKNWVHLDIAGPAFIKEEAFYNKKGATGVMIRTIIEFLENYNEIVDI
ncbi:MAG: leucyl aminopeptidase [Spirochaetes bacterium]|nr:leucyl aminopeptidase [Spirochaetota bacterium]